MDIEITCLDSRTEREFTKHFDNMYNARVFVLRCKYGGKILVTGISGLYSEQDLNFVQGW